MVDPSLFTHWISEKPRLHAQLDSAVRSTLKAIIGSRRRQAAPENLRKPFLERDARRLTAPTIIPVYRSIK